MPSAEQVLQRLEWQVIRPLDGLLQGDYRSLFFGSGLDLAGVREYEPGDDIRYMDWNITARLSVPYVRQYMEDREINAWFLLDLTPSVDFGTRTRTKRDLLVEFVGVVARLLTRRGNRVGALLYTGRLEGVVRCRSGRLQVLRLLNDLMRPPAARRSGLTDLGELLEAARAVIARRSLVFVVSDFISTPGWERLLRTFGRRHDVVGVRIADIAEEELPDVGGIFLEDAETGDQLFVDTSDGGLRARFRQLADHRKRAVSEAFERAHADLLSLSTEDDLVAAIVRFNALRKERRRVARAAAALP